MRKEETRQLAAELGLAVAHKPDSQDICFVPTGRYTSIVEKLHPGAAEAGDIVHLDGRVLGQHGGIINFTIGQRRGIGIASGEPLYVIRLDAARRTVVVGPREALMSRRIALRDVNWLGDGDLNGIPADGLAVWARIRSSQPPQPATLLSDGKGITVRLAEGEDGISPGQACVLYDSDAMRARILGGGWIISAERD